MKVQNFLFCAMQLPLSTAYIKIVFLQYFQHPCKFKRNITFWERNISILQRFSYLENSHIPKVGSTSLHTKVKTSEFKYFQWEGKYEAWSEKATQIDVQLEVGRIIKSKQNTCFMKFSKMAILRRFFKAMFYLAHASEDQDSSFGHKPTLNSWHRELLVLNAESISHKILISTSSIHKPGSII